MTKSAPSYLEDHDKQFSTLLCCIRKSGAFHDRVVGVMRISKPPQIRSFEFFCFKKKKEIIYNWTFVDIIPHVTVMELRTQKATTTSAPFSTVSLFLNQIYRHLYDVITYYHELFFNDDISVDHLPSLLMIISCQKIWVINFSKIFARNYVFYLFIRFEFNILLDISSLVTLWTRFTGSLWCKSVEQN